MKRIGIKISAAISAYFTSGEISSPATTNSFTASDSLTDNNAATSDASVIAFLKLLEPRCHKAQLRHVRDQGASGAQALQQRLDMSERDRVSPLALMSERIA